jgi:hypothetical protein
MANVNYFSEKTKRRVASIEECKIDLTKELPIFFRAFSQAVSEFEKEIIMTPPEARARGFEASMLNSKMIHSIQQNFKDGWKFGKYRRFILRVNGYNILFKKLNNRCMPMNIKTKNVMAISQQLSFPLFDEYSEVVEPILFFGYRKDRIGNVIDPQLVYIDDNKARWNITEGEIMSIADEVLSNAEKTESASPKIRPEVQKKKVMNNL